ncbi:TetM/TetW/TetO/TetS family tetracycline resistance ribosomal protection protein [Jiangella ureilytica]|uniref:TetM/TetW/TetO/TetS family tetracycline resistance ribosomal protection protein n=1 Tax=Jiangella ureilytica TaxID=2530374 RepID=A0A4R4RK15_9ACTN|nr:TetM/TetW/TetO/TetS family tetracycline resistance ribosomal protection protein [Jiangella ureilytica]TDC48942.1 TetM/TetW/TetO/TetS family tetracycline resistance ribosomal protection protein [Jiangella ureilytica]
MRTLNLGILAHVDAGKTSLTERLLYAAGVIDEIGSVDAGSTQTDSLALERQRGITIKSAVVAFTIGAGSDATTVDLIDTPGHPDFIAEVERVLSVLDGAVLVVSAVEGVQAQTRVLMRTLRRLRIPTLIFVNKLDRGGADLDAVVDQLATTLTPRIVPLGTAEHQGTKAAAFRPFRERDAGFRARLLDVLADGDEALFADYVEDPASVSYRRLRRALARQSRQARVHPVFAGSAITGAGIDELTTGIARLLPSTSTSTATATATATADDGGGTAGPPGPPRGTVFKVERGPAGEKIAYVRMVAGALRTRDRVTAGKVTAISVFDDGGTVPRAEVPAGRIAKVWGLAGVRIGDDLGEDDGDGRENGGGHHFAPPTLETVVVPRLARQKGALHAALAQLAEQDPLIDLRQDDLRQEVSVSLYGEVQKEVVQATLAEEYGIEVEFRESTTIHVERLIGTGDAVELIKKDGNPFLAGIGLRLEPAPERDGVTFELEIELGALPLAFIRAIDETARETLRQGLHGWQVPDCRVVLTRSQYAPRQSHMHATFDKSMSSTAGDFRGLTPLVLMTALRRAGTRVLEPIHRFELELPADTLGQLLPALARLRAVPGTPAPAPAGTGYVLDGDLPAAHVHALQQQLPALTRGEGVLETRFDRYQPVHADPPDRPRTDHDPLNRKEYLLRVSRRV